MCRIRQMAVAAAAAVTTTTMKRKKKKKQTKRWVEWRRRRRRRRRRERSPSRLLPKSMSEYTVHCTNWRFHILTMIDWRQDKFAFAACYHTMKNIFFL